MHCLSKQKDAVNIRKMENSRKNILMPHGGIKELAEKLSVSCPTVRSALRGRTHTLLAMKIRKLALQLGGLREEDV